MLEETTSGKTTLEGINEMKSKREEHKSKPVKENSWKRQIDPLE